MLVVEVGDLKNILELEKKGILFHTVLIRELENKAKVASLVVTLVMNILDGVPSVLRYVEDIANSKDDKDFDKKVENEYNAFKEFLEENNVDSIEGMVFI